MSRKKIWSAPIALIVVLVSALIFGGITVSADTVAEGECGTNATWTLDSDGTLTISGTGDMEDYGWERAPWYSHSLDIKKIVIEDGITHLGLYSFMRLKNVTSVTIGSGVKSFENSVFYEDSALTSVTIPAGVETMGYSVFQGCSALTTVTFEENSALTRIPENTFSGCVNLVFVNLPDSITEIGGHAFTNCELITSVVIPSNVETIGDSAFFDCDNLASVTLNEGLITIERCAFKYCRNLTTINFPSTLTTISYEVFSYCGFTSVNVPSTVTSFGQSAFSYCTNLKSATITVGEGGYCESLFANCSNLETATINGNAKSLGFGIFSGCESLTSVTIPDTVENIYQWAFSNCTSLESITLPSALKNIGSSVFDSCTSLTSIDLPNGVENIGERAFAGSGITSVTIPANAEISGSAFSGCQNLQTVSLAQGVDAIPAYAFYGCKSLKTVSIPNTVKSIGESAFEESSIESVVIPGSVVTIGESAFYNCYKLTSVTICDGVKNIEEGAFCGCGGLQSITIPGSVEYITEDSFSCCYELMYVEFLEGVKYIDDYAFGYCNAIETIIIPSTIKSIDVDSFIECNSVSHIYCKAAPGFDWLEDGDDFNSFYEKATLCHVGAGLADDFAAEYPDVNVTFVDGTINDLRLVGHSITLSADIGVNFYLRLPDGYNANNTEVTFSWGVGDKATTAKGKLVAVNQYGANYKVTCGVASYSMGDEITMVVKSGNDVLITDTYSVAEYINVLGYSADYDELQNLLAAMVYYGSNSQIYFDYRTDHDVYDLTRNYIDEIYRDTVTDFRNDLETQDPDPSWLTIMGIDSEELGIKYYGASVLCGSQNKVRFYFEVKDATKINSLTASYNSQNLTFKSKTLNGKNLVYIETPGLAAGAIENAITVTIGGNSYTYDFRYYIQQCIIKDDEQHFASVACYLYAVSHFAKIYQGGSSNA